jgi:hypothetical protein
LIPITDKSKIEGFIGKIRTLNMPEEDRQNIITGLEN